MPRRTLAEWGLDLWQSSQEAHVAAFICLRLKNKWISLARRYLNGNQKLLVEGLLRAMHKGVFTDLRFLQTISPPVNWWR